MSDDNVARFLKKYAEAAHMKCSDVPGKVTPHMFRHSRALNLYRRGMPLPLISEWLGHSDFSTTANVYAHLDINSKLLSAEAISSAFSFKN